jgi:hypothetical protein
MNGILSSKKVTSTSEVKEFKIQNNTMDPLIFKQDLDKNSKTLNKFIHEISIEKIRE